MHIKHFMTLSLVVALLFTSACAQQGGQGSLNKQDIGTLAGAIGGAFAGSTVGKGKGKVLTVAAGTLLGGYLGKEIGASLDRADMAYYNKTSQYALENTKSGTTSSWSNPDSGHGGTITPKRTYQVASGEYCREYTQTINVGGRTVEGVGTACRQPDGSWAIQN